MATFVRLEVEWGMVTKDANVLVQVIHQSWRNNLPACVRSDIQSILEPQNYTKQKTQLSLQEGLSP